MPAPRSLFKYLPSQFARRLVDKGDLLFRNLAHFRKLEERGRADVLEGLHMDRPDAPVTIESVDGRAKWRGHAAFLNSVDPNRIFVFCVSTVLSEALFEEFAADACVEITDAEAFVGRLRAAVERDRYGFAECLEGQALYYAPNLVTPHAVTDTKVLPFFKHESYRHQHEHRFVLAEPGGLTLTRRIVNHLFSWDEEVASGISRTKNVEIGSIADIALVHRR